MEETETDLDPYRILQVDPTADHEVIQAAYRALARRFHPDVAPDEAIAAQRMAVINAAFDLIRDPKRRAAFDRVHFTARAMDGGTGTGALPATPGAGTAATASDAAGAYQAGGATWSRGASWEGTAGPPPGRPSGSVLSFGRFKGWSLGEIARADPGYLLWLEDKREGRPYLTEIDQFLHRLGIRKPAEEDKKGSFWRS